MRGEWAALPAGFITRLSGLWFLYPARATPPFSRCTLAVNYARRAPPQKRGVRRPCLHCALVDTLPCPPCSQYFPSYPRSVISPIVLGDGDVPVRGPARRPGRRPAVGSVGGPLPGLPGSALPGSHRHAAGRRHLGAGGTGRRHAVGVGLGGRPRPAAGRPDSEGGDWLGGRAGAPTGRAHRPSALHTTPTISVAQPARPLLASTGLPDAALDAHAPGRSVRQVGGTPIAAAAAASPFTRDRPRRARMGRGVLPAALCHAGSTPVVPP